MLSHPVAPKDELVQIGRYVYLMPYAPFAYRERNVSDYLDEHVLVVGSLDGLKLGRPYLPMMLRCERASCDGHIATGVDERWCQSSSTLDDNAYGTGVIANRADLASVELSFLSIGELRAGPEPMFGSSASPRDRSLSSRSCSCTWWSYVTSESGSGSGSGSGRCGALCLDQLRFDLRNSLAEHRYLVLFLQLRKLFL